MQHLFVVPWLTPSRRTLRGITVVAILVFGFFAILKTTSGGTGAPAKELITGSIPRAASVPKPRPTIQWPLSSVQPQPNLPRSCKARRWIDAPFRCRVRDQNGFDTRFHGLRPQGEPAMSDQAVEERRGWTSDIVWGVADSILVLLVMLLWAYVPA